MTSRFKGEVAVVTGGAQGIGAGIVDRLSRDGARLVIADVNEAAATKLAALLRDRGADALGVGYDVSEPMNHGALSARVEAEFGQPYRYFVCNAGVQTFARALDLTTDEWDRVMSVNARGTLLGLQEAGRVMPDGAAVVSIASIQGRLGAPNYAHYAASKASVLSLTKSFAVALAPRRIRVNSVAPGIIETPLWDVADEALTRLKQARPGVVRAQRIASVPLGRAGKPEDVGAAVSFLLSDDAAYITGECIHVCGGDVML